MHHRVVRSYHGELTGDIHHLCEICIFVYAKILYLLKCRVSWYSTSVPILHIIYLCVRHDFTFIYILFDCVAGSVYFYSKTGSSWSRQGKILAADGAASDYFGRSMSLYTSSALIGAPFDDDKALNAGEYSEVWRYDECTP